MEKKLNVYEVALTEDDVKALLAWDGSVDIDAYEVMFSIIGQIRLEAEHPEGRSI